MHPIQITTFLDPENEKGEVTCLVEGNYQHCVPPYYGARPEDFDEGEPEDFEVTSITTVCPNCGHSEDLVPDSPLWKQIVEKHSDELLRKARSDFLDSFVP